MHIEISMNWQSAEKLRFEEYEKSKWVIYMVFQPIPTWYTFFRIPGERV